MKQTNRFCTASISSLLALCVFSIILCASCASAPQTTQKAQTAPSWYFDKEKEYPSVLYIAAVGEGASRSQAETAALAQVSLFFNTKTEVRNQMVKEYNEYFESSMQISEAVNIQSDAEFLGIQFTDVWHNPEQNRFFALAYIDRANALRIYDSRITQAAAQTEAYLTQAVKETDLLRQYGLLKKAVAPTQITQEYIQLANTVQSGGTSRYGTVEELHLLAQTMLDKVHTALSFKVIALNDRDGRMKRTILDLFEAEGYKGDVSNAPYTVLAQISTNEDEMPSGKFIRAGIDITIVNTAAEVLFTYNKNYGRNGGVSFDGAYNRAFFEMEKDLKENFIHAFNTRISQSSH